MISISGAAGLELPGHPADLRHREEQQPVLSKNSPAPSGWTDSKCWVSPDNFRGARQSQPGQFRRRGIDDGKDRSFPIETTFRIGCRACASPDWTRSACDVGVDGEIPGGVNAAATARISATTSVRTANRVHALTIDTTIRVSTFLLSNVSELAKRPLSAEFQRPS